MWKVRAGHTARNQDGHVSKASDYHGIEQHAWDDIESVDLDPKEVMRARMTEVDYAKGKFV